jgi:hypothetical protein
MIYGEHRGIKTELASEEEWESAGPVVPKGSPSGRDSGNLPLSMISADQNELLKVLESSIRQKVEGEIRKTLQDQAVSSEAQAKILQGLKESFEQEEENRRLAVRMALIAEGDQILTQLMMVWQQAKQNGEGGAQWNEVKVRLLELLDATVQLTHSG